ncbi:hypothetical protein FOCG_11409 [Fusarium oxysporum f. sp. radicis-lycopersici 26381]|uniref:F-box domain-containing protein n=2 Tax=Fusarium oxysporum Fo47 TaxID=660027 RepID=W9KQG4_FUSOX|nr:uncharacterized protein FOBCDRAFT_214162 [Fusarium oxysporum Fo47]EWZ84717.1 hypothetical protein FOWG_12460 [Fusarium oxysporum f. sp. lycopersici MN25]EXL47186.1 hypothetical protein FOCG_11409 [Fusarium oxysporum f. sp. radicis-lycopersici 26381]KAJ4277399.1 hypothetical protein NW764_16679 [Fusarium oxysporum]EWZ46707.1 hypothetical protein FOZG_02796 [Fusarium oxysporum Fo47]QKD48969.2 hypothetical protein FOBCDRAFT_214162 [Fusarium oxysporum Fo47]
MPVQLRSRPGASGPRVCCSTTAFRVPSTISTGSSSDSALLFKLPPEVLTMIFDQAPQVDKIMLAMTCKSLLATSRLCGLSVPLRESHMATWTRPDSSRFVASCSCLSMGDLLRRFRPRDARGRPSRAWSWCLDCCRYLPTRRGWWERRMKRDHTTISQDYMPNREPSIDWFSRGLKQQCPICYLEDVQ